MNKTWPLSIKESGSLGGQLHYFSAVLYLHIPLRKTVLQAHSTSILIIKQAHITESSGFLL